MDGVVCVLLKLAKTTTLNRVCLVRCNVHRSYCRLLATPHKHIVIFCTGKRECGQETAFKNTRLTSSYTNEPPTEFSRFQLHLT